MENPSSKVDLRPSPNWLRPWAEDRQLEVHDLLAGLVIVIGLVGVVAVFVPGLALQVVAVTLWAFVESSSWAWAVLMVVVGIAVSATVLKYLNPGRRLRAAGIPGWLLLTAAAAAFLGFFVVPVVGAPIGFVLSIYVFERRRKGKTAAWPSTKQALRAIAASIGIELAGAFLIAVVFFAAALAL